MINLLWKHAIFYIKMDISIVKTVLLNKKFQFCSKQPYLDPRTLQFRSKLPIWWNEFTSTSIKVTQTVGFLCFRVFPFYCVSGFEFDKFFAVLFIAAGDFCLTEFRGRRLRTDKRKLKMIDAFTRVSYRGPESFIRNLRIPNGSCDMTEHVIRTK